MSIDRETFEPQAGAGGTEVGAYAVPVRFMVASPNTWRLVFTGGKLKQGTMFITDDSVMFTGKTMEPSRVLTVSHRLVNSLVNPLNLVFLPFDVMSRPESAEYRFPHDTARAFYDEPLKRLYFPIDDERQLYVQVVAKRKEFEALLDALRQRLGDRLTLAPGKLGTQMWVTIAIGVVALGLAIAFLAASWKDL